MLSDRISLNSFPYYFDHLFRTNNTWTARSFSVTNRGGLIVPINSPVHKHLTNTKRMESFKNCTWLHTNCVMQSLRFGSLYHPTPFQYRKILYNVLAPKLENSMNNRIKMADSKFKCNIFLIFNCNSIYGQTVYINFYPFCTIIFHN